MQNEAKTQDPQQRQQPATPGNQQGTPTPPSSQHDARTDFDGLKDKKAEELTPEELRWMADTMPGDGPGD